MWTRRTLRPVLPFALLAALTHCDEGATGTGRWIHVSVSPDSLHLDQGGVASVAVTVTRSPAYSGPVTVDPNTGSFRGGVFAESDTVSAGQTMTSLVFRAQWSANPVPRGIVVYGIGRDGQTASDTVTVMVRAATPYTASLDPPALSLRAGTSAMVTLSIERASGYQEGIEVWADANLLELTVTGTGFDSPDRTALTIAAASNLAPGTYDVYLYLLGDSFRATYHSNVTLVLPVTVFGP